DQQARHAAREHAEIDQREDGQARGVHAPQLAAHCAFPLRCYARRRPLPFRSSRSFTGRREAAMQLEDAMTRARSWWFAVLLVGALGLPTAARAGVVIVTESEEPGDAVGKSGQPPAASAKAANDPAAKDKRRLTGLLYASGTDVRMEGTRTDADEKESGTVLFRGANDTLIVIDDQEKTYFEITRAAAKRLASSLESARAQIRAQME